MKTQPETEVASATPAPPPIPSKPAAKRKKKKKKAATAKAPAAKPQSKAKSESGRLMGRPPTAEVMEMVADLLKLEVGEGYTYEIPKDDHPATFASRMRQRIKLAYQTKRPEIQIPTSRKFSISVDLDGWKVSVYRV